MIAHLDTPLPHVSSPERAGHTAGPRPDVGAPPAVPPEVRRSVVPRSLRHLPPPSWKLGSGRPRKSGRELADALERTIPPWSPRIELSSEMKAIGLALAFGLGLAWQALSWP